MSETLKRLGYVTWRRTPAGLIVFVLESEQFPKGHPRVKVAPSSDERLIAAAFTVLDGVSGTDDQGTEKLCKSAHHAAQNGQSVDETRLSDIREEVVFECEKKSVTSVNLDLPKIDNLGSSTGRRDSTNFFLRRGKAQSHHGGA